MKTGWIRFVSDAVLGRHGDRWDAGTVTDEDGVCWRLLFDEKTVQPSNPLSLFNGRRAEIEGRSLHAEEPTVLVHSLKIVI